MRRFESVSSKPASVWKPWPVRFVPLLAVLVACCLMPSVARAQPPGRAHWELNLQAQGVTPTSHFVGAARFSVPARHRHPRYHQPAPYGYPTPVPAQPAYVLQERSNRALVWSGALLFGIPYAVGLTYSVVADFPGRTEYLAIPLVGPWLLRNDESDRATRIMLGLNGLTQATGAALLTLGLTLTRKEWVPYQMGDVWVAPATSARGVVGFVAGGKF